MTAYKKTWSDAKTQFEADTNGKKPAETVKTAFGTVRKGTGIEAALGDLDDAFKKGHRTAAADALQKFYVVYGAYEKVLQIAQKAARDADDDANMTAVATLSSALKKILAQIDVDLKKLKTEKAGGGETLPVDTFLGDVKGQIDTYKKAAASFKEYETKWTLVKKSEPLVKALTSYQNAAAKNKFADAVKALDLMKVEVDKLVDHCKKIQAATIPTNYDKAVDQFRKFIGNLWESRWKLAKMKAVELRDADAG